MSFKNGDVYPVNLKTCDVLFVYENICDKHFMIGLISEVSEFGLLTFLNLL